MSVRRLLAGFLSKSVAPPSGSAGLIGVPGQQGFGVGVCPDQNWLTELGLSEMTGTSDPTHENYGNYQHTNGGISVFVPKFFYRIGSTGSPLYAQYGLNCIDIVGIETFTTEYEANAAGFALHRAFIDDGKEKSGFFYDKYLASKDGTTSCKSVKNAHPISLVTGTTYEASATMSGCVGYPIDALVLSRARGYGWNAPSIFMTNAIAKIAMAHGQAATSSDFCAWYDATDTTNFPKGCNNNVLGDVDDASVTFTAATSKKPLTGSASNLAKTTHNGQVNGITDVNGAIFQVTIGVTTAGTTAAAGSSISGSTCYVLKPTSKHADLTEGWGGATDAWGDSTSLLNMFDVISIFTIWGNTTGWQYFGNGTNQVFSGAMSGTDYLRSCSGIPISTMAISNGGTKLFGNDGIYRSLVQNLCPLAAGDWFSSIGAGVHHLAFNLNRVSSLNRIGFRSAAYGS